MRNLHLRFKKVCRSTQKQNSRQSDTNPRDRAVHHTQCDKDLIREWSNIHTDYGINIALVIIKSLSFNTIRSVIMTRCKLVATIKYVEQHIK